MVGGPVHGDNDGHDALADFVTALREAGSALHHARDRIAGAGVPDDAFGRLYEARAVHDAYRQRLPQLERDAGEAARVMAEMVSSLSGPRSTSDPVPARATDGPTVPVPRDGRS